LGKGLDIVNSAATALCCNGDVVGVIARGFKVPYAGFPLTQSLLQASAFSAVQSIPAAVALGK